MPGHRTDSLKRFLFTVNKSLFKARKVGVMREFLLVFPRLNMNV